MHFIVDIRTLPHTSVLLTGNKSTMATPGQHRQPTTAATPPRQPVIMSRRGNQRANGAIPPVNHTNMRSPPTNQPAMQTRNTGIRLKIQVRRLPPGLTEAEFKEAIGEDWLPGKERVDWMSYQPGKISKE